MTKLPRAVTILSTKYSKPLRNSYRRIRFQPVCVCGARESLASPPCSVFTPSTRFQHWPIRRMGSAAMLQVASAQVKMTTTAAQLGSGGALRKKQLFHRHLHLHLHLQARHLSQSFSPPMEPCLRRFSVRPSLETNGAESCAIAAQQVEQFKAAAASGTLQARGQQLHDLQRRRHALQECLYPVCNDHLQTSACNSLRRRPSDQVRYCHRMRRRLCACSNTSQARARAGARLRERVRASQRPGSRWPIRSLAGCEALHGLRAVWLLLEPSFPRAGTPRR